MGLLSKLLTAGFMGSELYTGRTDKPLITFEGWQGQWWKRIKPGKALVSAIEDVGPAKVWIPLMASEAVWNAYQSHTKRRRRTTRRRRRR